MLLHFVFLVTSELELLKLNSVNDFDFVPELMQLRLIEYYMFVKLNSSLNHLNLSLYM